MIGQTAQAAAAPPASPLVEGREQDLVAREYYQPDQPIAVYVRAPDPAPKPGAWLVLTIIVWDALLDHLTVPLGTADVQGDDGRCGA
jgi:hypothetical protein